MSREENLKILRQFQAESYIPKSNWIEWEHVEKGDTHCPTCLSLHKCWFLETKMPDLPQHPYCHCRKKNIPQTMVNLIAWAECRINKFDEYVFNPDPTKNDGKKDLFEGFGYDIMDSEWLQKEFERQALEKYIKGNYELGVLDKYGQRISIIIEFPKKTKTKLQLYFPVG